MNAIAPRSGSPITAELRERIEDIISSARRYSGDGGDDPGFVLAPRAVAWHPDAGQAAAALRALREQTADQEAIADWLEVLAGSVGNPPASAHAMGIRITAISIACRDIPACIWSLAALAEALQAFTFWPSGAEIFALLKRHDDRQLAEIAALDKIADGVRAAPRAGPVRESTVAYPVQPVPPNIGLPRLPVRLSTEDVGHVEDVPFDREAAIAALGVSPAEIEASRQKAALRFAKPVLPRAANDSAPSSKAGGGVMSGASQLRPHPIASLLPAMTVDEYAELRESIRANGQREPVTLHRNGTIIDGRHRARACGEPGLPVASTVFDGDDAELVNYVLDLNLKRRHLNEMQRAMVAAELETGKHGGDRRSDQDAPWHLDRATAAKLAHVSTRTVARAATVRDHAIPAIVEAARMGQLVAAHAERVARLPVASQERVARELGNGKSVATIVLAASRSHRVDKIEAASIMQPLSAFGRTFPVIYADPPWHQEPWSEGGQLKAPEMKFPTMSVADICAMAVADITADDAVLFMWAMPNMLPEALTVIAAWGFRFCTSAVWVKPHITCGHRFRGQHEPIICATRGKMPPPPDGLCSSVFTGPAATGEFASKPDSVRDWIASAYPHAGRIELFARTAAPGWFVWGNQAPAAAA